MGLFVSWEQGSSLFCSRWGERGVFERVTGDLFFFCLNIDRYLGFTLRCGAYIQRVRQMIPRESTCVNRIAGFSNKSMYDIEW